MAPADSEDAGDGEARRRRPGLDGLLVALAAIVVHARSLAFGFTYLDDADLVVDDQPFLARPSSLWRAFGRAYMSVVDKDHAYYRPLVTVSYAIDAQIGGAAPRAYHATNVALHAVASVLVWRLARRLSFGRGVALGAAIVFAVHPAVVPAVAWIPGRNDTLLAVFALSAWLLFLRARRAPSLAAGAPSVAAHLAFFGLALLTKETAVVLPLVCAAHAVIVDRAVASDRRRSLFAAAVFGLGWAALVVVRLLVRPPSGASLRDVVANAPVLLTALGSIALPLHPSVLADAADLSPWPGIAALVVLGAGASLVPGVRRRVVAFGAVVLVLWLVPALAAPCALVLGQRLYLPLVGAVIAGAEILRAVGALSAPQDRSRVAFASVAIAALAGLALLDQEPFRDRRSFAKDAVAASPRSPLAHLCLGQSYQLAGDDARALGEYQAALALGPAQVVHNNIAVLHMKAGRWSEAERELRDELALNPGYARAYYNLGIVLRREGRRAEACDAEGLARGRGAEDDATKREQERDCAGP